VHLRAEVLTERGQLQAVHAAWDELARAQAAPCSAPSWGLAWWDHAAPAGARLRVIVVRDADEVVGIAPLYCHRDRGVMRYGFIGDRVSSPVGPLARAGAQTQVAAAIAAELARCRPRPDVVAFGNQPATSPWPDLLRAHWSGRGRPLLLRREGLATPYVGLDGSYDQWVAQQSRNFRQQLRRHRRRLEARGAVFRMVTDAAELDDRIDDFARLHHARFEGRGGSAVLDGGVTRMLSEAGTRMLAGERFRLWVIEAEGKVISAHLLLAAGGRVTYWLGGFDDEWGSEQPALQTLAVALEHTFASGGTVFDLGPGLQDYKLRFTKQTVPGIDALLAPPGPRRALTLARVLPPRLRHEAIRRARRAVPQETKDAVRGWLRRVRPGAAQQPDHLV
jgi:CelD/BcsL family acetyltransferase involved in cellulose biosynthesis